MSTCDDNDLKLTDFGVVGWVDETVEVREDFPDASEGSTEPSIAVPRVEARQEEKILVEELLAALTPHQRRIVRLHFLEGAPYADIAATLGLAVGTVKATIHQSLNRMRLFMLQ